MFHHYKLHNSKIVAVIFDIGNVLVKVDLNWQIAFAKINVVYTKDFFINHANPDIDQQNMITQFGIGKITKAQLLEYIKTKAGKDNITLEAFSNAWNSVVTEIFSGALETICQLKQQGYKVYALSDTNELHFEHIEQLFKNSQFATEYPGLTFRTLFDKCYLSHETGFRKSQNEAWLQILEDQGEGLTAEKFLFVDDLEPNITRAGALGFKVLHYKPENTMNDVLAVINMQEQYANNFSNTRIGRN